MDATNPISFKLSRIVDFVVTLGREAKINQQSLRSFRIGLFIKVLWVWIAIVPAISTILFLKNQI